MHDITISYVSSLDPGAAGSGESESRNDSIWPRFLPTQVQRAIAVQTLVCRPGPDFDALPLWALEIAKSLVDRQIRSVVGLPKWAMDANGMSYSRLSYSSWDASNVVIKPMMQRFCGMFKRTGPKMSCRAPSQLFHFCILIFICGDQYQAYDLFPSNTKGSLPFQKHQGGSGDRSGINHCSHNVFVLSRKQSLLSIGEAR